MLRIGLLVLCTAFACRDAPSGPPPAPITQAEIESFMPSWVSHASHCVPTDINELIDSAGFARIVMQKDVAADVGRRQIEGSTGVSFVATKICGWMSAGDHYDYLHVRKVGSELRPILRKLSGNGVTYHELRLTRAGTTIRVTDLYSYFTGQWVSDELVGALGRASGIADATAFRAATDEATRLEDAGKPAEALAALDKLAPKWRSLRSIQARRVRIAQRVSESAYVRAIDELTRVFPHDPSTLLVRVDGATLRGDFTSALELLDELYATIGPDPYLDGLRAVHYALRKQPGDLDEAERRAQQVIAEAPTLAIGTFARLAVAISKKDWPSVVAIMTDMNQRFGITFDETWVRASVPLRPLLGRPEYEAWRAAHR